jgi:hypothetical protein
MKMGRGKICDPIKFIVHPQPIKINNLHKTALNWMKNEKNSK